MKKLMLLAFLLCSIGWVNAQFPIKLDVGRTEVAAGPGWQKFLSSNSGVTLYDGIKVTIAGTGTPTYQYRTDTNYVGIPDENMWRDFVYAPADKDLIVTIENLRASTIYDISIGAFDYRSNTSTPRAADWKVNGVTVFTTSFGIPNVPIATLMPSAERNYIMSARITSDGTGKIVMQSARAGGGTAHAFVNCLIIDQPLWPTDPQPADKAIDVPLDTMLSWTTGPDPNNPSQPNPAIRMHYLYLQADDPNLADVTPISIAAGTPVAATGSYGPLNLEMDKMDKTYYWRVDEAVDNGLGGYTAPGAAGTITGKAWSFETIKSFATISGQPANAKPAPGSTAEFTAQYSSFSPGMVMWYKDSAPVIAGGDISISDTGTSTTLSIANVDASDEGAYKLTVTNDAGPVESQTAYLVVQKLLAHYPFEQNGDDVVGINDGTPVNGMDYSAGLVTAGGQTFAADPNGANYLEVPATTAYPRAGFGKGLEEFTYAFWVKRGTFTGNGRIFGTLNKEGVAADFKNTGVQINVTGTGSLGCYIRQENNQFRELNTAADTIGADQWYFVAFTFKEGLMKCFVNGDFLEQRDYTALEPMVNFVDWQFPMALMARNVRGVVDEFYPGELDDLRIYNYVLSDEGIAQLYYDETGIRPCIYEVSQFDFTNDCQVNIDDFAMFAADWLTNGLFVPQN